MGSNPTPSATTALAKLHCRSYALHLMADQGRSRHEVWASEASLTLLGPMRLVGKAGEDWTPKARKTRALVAIVALAKGPVTRGRLTDLLWGDRGEEQAKASLRQALYELRDFAGAGLLTANRDTVTAGPKRLWTDVGEIESADQPADLADALDQIDWPPLGDLDDVTPELDDWLRAERTRISSLVLQRGTGAAEQANAGGEPAVARLIADALERVDPLDERAAQAGARADIALGDRAAAHRRIERLAKRLHDELGLKPSPDTQALLSQMPAPTASPAVAGSQDQPSAEHSRRRWLLPAILLAAMVAVALFYVLRPGGAEARPSVAVLPFEEVGQRTRNYFATGVSDEILNLLSHQQRIRVLGRVSAEEIAARPNSLEFARGLGMSHLLDGSVRTAGNRVLVIVTLTRVSDGEQMWSERYERELGDIFAVQGEVARTVATRLSRSLGQAMPQVTSPEVYDRYLAARQLVRDRREVTLKEAERLLREAIARDPRYAPAVAELSQVLLLRSDQPTSYGTLPYRQARAEAESLARRAVQLDPSLGDAYAALGFLFLYDERATPYYRKAVALNPQRSDYRRWLAQSLWIGSRYNEAIEQYRRAIEIDPLWGINYEHLTGQLHYIGKDAEAAEVARRFLALSSDERSKLQLLRSLANDENRAADNLRYSHMLFAKFPDERIMRFWLASPLAMLGEHRAAAELMTGDPATHALLQSDWTRFSRESERIGPEFWDRANLWSAAKLLLATGHSSLLVKLYDDTQPLIRAGIRAPNSVAIPEVAIALRGAGRNEEADHVLGFFERNSRKLPSEGLGQVQRQIELAVLAFLFGRKGEGVQRIDDLSRKRPLALTMIPAMSLLNNPLFAAARNDSRLRASDERVRAALNAERRKAGLPPIGREAWISDPKTLLTKN